MLDLEQQIFRQWEKSKNWASDTIAQAEYDPVFVAGIGSMTYGRFLVYNVLGGVIWVVGFILGGYFFGNIPAVRSHFSLVILAIIIVSVLPGVIEFLRVRHDV